MKPPISEWILRYEAGCELLESAVAGMTTSERLARPIEGKWSSLEVVCHIADSEQFFADRMKRTLAMDCPLLIFAEAWRYPEAVRYHDRDIAEELALVRITRSQMCRILRLVPEGAWTRTAVHSEKGKMTLRDLLFHAIEHLEHHVATIQEKRTALRKV